MNEGRLSRVALAVALLPLVAGCGVSGLSFLADDRLSITSPESRSSVAVPVTLRWTIEDFEVTGPTGRAVPDAGYFGVFVDRAPQAPGRTVESLFEGEPACAADPGCPDEADLASRGVYTTSGTELTIDRIPDLTDGQSRDLHEVTVVLLDGEGERIGESAFSVDFEVVREQR